MKRRASKPAEPGESTAAPPASLRLEWRTAEELDDNPANWKDHPPAQLDALKGLIRSDVGWAGAALFNEVTGRLIDGHARKKLLKPGEPMPVLVGSWTLEQEAKILATLDPVGALAIRNDEALLLLLQGMTSEDEAVEALLETLREDARELPPLARPPRESRDPEPNLCPSCGAALP